MTTWVCVTNDNDDNDDDGPGQFEMVGGSRRWGSRCAYDFYSTRSGVSGRFFSPNYPQHYPPGLRQVLLSQLPSTLPARYSSQAGSSLPTTLNTTRRILGASTRSLARRLSASRSRFRTSALNMSTAGKRYVILVICPRLYSVVFFVFVTILS